MILRKPLALLFDMDGVPYNDTMPIDGASEPDVILESVASLPAWLTAYQGQ